MVVLNEGHFKSGGSLECARVVALEEKSTLISEDFRLDQDGAAARALPDDRELP